MFLEYFKITGFAVIQIFLLAAIGYFLVKKNILQDAGLDTLSSLVINISLPILIFCQLIRDFSFTLYPNWWIFPFISMLISCAGLVSGLVFIGFIRDFKKKLQFLSLITFQNSGYLPLALVAALLPKDKLAPMFIYIFLFLLGFNFIIWSVGVYMLNFSRIKRFELGSLPPHQLQDYLGKTYNWCGGLFSPPVIATLFSLIFVFLGLSKIIPDFLFKPLKILGDCTLPLAMLVVGGSLAQIKLKNIDKKAILLMSLAKLIVLPVLGILLIIRLNPPELIGLLIVMQLAMPPAASLAVITKHYKNEDVIISQGVFFGHILSIVTIPVFLSLYFALFMVR